MALYMHYFISPSNGGLQVHSKVLTGIVPGYLLGQTMKKSSTRKKVMTSTMGITRTSPGQLPIGYGWTWATLHLLAHFRLLSCRFVEPRLYGALL